MAPPKNTGGGGDKGKSVAVVATSTRRTRSMDRQTRSQTQGRGNSSASKRFNFESPEKRKRKAKAKEGGAAATKKIKKEKEEAVVEDDAADDEEDEEEVAETKTIVIEHCKQHKSFKERATEVKEGLEKAVPGIIVTVNPDKPRRGCFEIREEGGETFVSLLDMKKPFTEMTELNMEEVVANILERIK